MERNLRHLVKRCVQRQVCHLIRALIFSITGCSACTMLAFLYSNGAGDFCIIVCNNNVLEVDQVSFRQEDVQLFVFEKTQGCMFIATNCDAVTHLTDGREWADSTSRPHRLAGREAKRLMGLEVHQDNVNKANFLE